MVKSNSNSKRKTRSDKFPLTLHKTGQYCKKIKGKIYYFGTDRKQAFQKYLEQAAGLHNGKPNIAHRTEGLTVKALANEYLDHQESKVSAGEIKPRQLYDQTRLLRHFVKYVGPARLTLDVTTMDIQSYKKKLLKEGKSANTINNYISTIKAMYHWAAANEVVEKIPNLTAVKKISSEKRTRQIFEMQQINALLSLADKNLKAMILLGLNCGFGCTDCSELRWDDIDFKNSRIIFARTKTGINRNLPLWQETFDALKSLSKKGEWVFLTNRGNKYVRVVQRENVGESMGMLSYNEVSKQFSKLLKKAGLKTEKGVGFYTLRRTAATLAARSGDPFAVQSLLGHADLKMASVYVQDVSEQTDRVVNNVRKLIIQDDSLLSDKSSGEMNE